MLIKSKDIIKNYSKNIIMIQLLKEAKGFAPESEMLAALKAIPGITNIETQTYTLMPV